MEASVSELSQSSKALVITELNLNRKLITAFFANNPKPLQLLIQWILCLKFLIIKCSNAV